MPAGSGRLRYYRRGVESRTRVVVTAGHVDHGKSSLVLALTGTDPDRFDEEKRRGLTIDLGFAHCQLETGVVVSFIDVPGHVRFLRNMLAGVGGIDACIFVVAATEGWKPQSEEHLRILELLGFRDGVIALTKVDLVDDEWREIATLEVVDHVAGTFLEGAPIVPVAAPHGVGLDELRTALDALVSGAPGAADGERPRVWVDRVFAARGSGTVVTGTLTGGTLSVDDHVIVGVRQFAARIRRIQSHGQSVSLIPAGSRVALNLSGIEHTQVQRGDAVINADQWKPTERFDASLHVLDRVDHDVSRRGAYQAYIGAGEFDAKVRILGDDVIRPGGHGLVRLHLQAQLPIIPGDRFILRESGRSETVGGGEVLDIHPVLPASKARPDRNPDRVIRERGWVTSDDFWLITGVRRDPVLGRWIVDPAAILATLDSIRNRVQSAGPLGLDIASLDDRERAALSTITDITVHEGVARHAAEADAIGSHPFIGALHAALFSPPDPTNVDRNELRQLVRRKLVVERDGVFFHPAAIDAAASVVALLLAEHSRGYTMAQFRDALASTRKHALPLAAELDARGITRRRDDVRIAGPRLQDDPPGGGPAPG